MVRCADAGSGPGADRPGAVGRAGDPYAPGRSQSVGRAVFELCQQHVAQCRGYPGLGHARAVAPALEPAAATHHCRPVPCQRPRRAYHRDDPLRAHLRTVSGLGAGGVAGAGRPIVGGHDDCDVAAAGACPGARGNRHWLMEAIQLRPPELPAPEPTAGPATARAPAHAVATAHRRAAPGSGVCRPARRLATDPEGHQFQPDQR
ncbi:hypothetical protein D3C84_689130 [compost metagenome]